MIQLYLSKIHCDRETDEVGADEPYVFVIAVNLASTINMVGFPVPLPSFEVVRYGPFEDMDQGETQYAPGISQSFWSLTNTPATLNDPNEVIFVVGLKENDTDNPEGSRGIVKGGVAGSIFGSLPLSRHDKVIKLINDVKAALMTPSPDGINFDETIGDPQELRFSREDLIRAESGQVVSETLVFSGDGGQYTITFEARNPSPPEPWRLPSTVPSRQIMAMQAFRHRAEAAAQANLSGADFVGGFPNFYEATRGQDHFGGTVFVNRAGAEWRDVPLAKLGNVALEDFGERMRATNSYASREGFVGGFPTFFHADVGNGIVCGTVLLKTECAVWRDISLADLGNPPLDDFEARFRATQDYATRNGFVGGFPNMFHAETSVIVDITTGQKRRTTVCGTVLIKPGFAEWRDVWLFKDP
jgi:hypothetical protein